jgi:hypothetical protein
VPSNEVDAAVHFAMEGLNVWRLYADPPFWQDYVDAWYGEFGQEKVVRWYTNRDTQMARAVENFETAVTGRELTHDGDPILATHIGHAHRRKTRAGDVIEKESRDSTDSHGRRDGRGARLRGARRRDRGRRAERGVERGRLPLTEGEQCPTR